MYMKKWMCRVTLIGVLSLCGCGQVKEDEAIPSKEEMQSSVETQSNTKEEQKDASEITSQIALIGSEKDLWLQGMDYANDMEGYTITDMDGNGRLELIASNCGGTGHYTYSRFYEVNETYDGLVICETNFTEGDSQPDIMSNGGLVIVYEDEQGVRYHLFEDMLHDVADYYYTKFAVSLQNGKVFGTPLATNLVSYSDAEEYPTYTHMNGMGEVISQEEYASMISDTFPEECKKYVVNWSWIEKQKLEKASRQELEGILQEAYEATTWNTQEELSHYGKWTIEECVGYAKVSAVSKEEAATYIGKELTYEKNKFCFDQAVMSLSEAGYGFEVDTKEEFFADFGITGLNVEIPSEFTWCHVLVDGSFFGQSFVILDDDRILIYYEGAFFEAVRVGGLEASLTMEQIEMLSQKPILATQDLLVYEGLQQTSLSAVDYKQYYYNFTHENKPYRLEFRSGADDKLQFVRLVDMESMLNIDIRTGNVEHLLNNTVTMADYLTYDLPEGVTASDYDLYQGHFGGEMLLKNGEPCGGIYILDGSRVKPGFSGDELLNVANYENNIFHEEAESLSLSGVPALLTLMTVEEEAGTEVQYYSIYFAKESGFYCYNIRLRADMFTKDEVLNVANSVVFESRAFAVNDRKF